MKGKVVRQSIFAFQESSEEVCNGDFIVLEQWYAAKNTFRVRRRWLDAR